MDFLSESGSEKKYHKHTNARKSPYEYVHALRIELAKLILVGIMLNNVCICKLLILIYKVYSMFFSMYSLCQVKCSNVILYGNL